VGDNFNSEDNSVQIIGSCPLFKSNKQSYSRNVINNVALTKLGTLKIISDCNFSSQE